MSVAVAVAKNRSYANSPRVSEYTLAYSICNEYIA